MVSAGRHPKSEVAAALTTAKQHGLTVAEDHKGHRWGWLTCPTCTVSATIWGTPRNPGTHAKQLARFTADHQHPATPGGGTP
jgi:hypothetical protein